MSKTVEETNDQLDKDSFIASFEDECTLCGQNVEEGQEIVRFNNALSKGKKRGFAHAICAKSFFVLFGAVNAASDSF